VAENERIKCGDCGYLGLRRGDGMLIEADGRYRTAGVRDVRHSPMPFGGRTITDASPRIPSVDLVDEELPRCLIRPEVDYRKKVEALYRLDGRLTNEAAAKAANVDRKDVGRVLQEEWHCDKFERWRPGRAPKELQDMVDRERMLEWQKAQERERLAWEAEQDRLRREFEKSEREADRALQQKLSADAASTQTSILKTQVVGLVIAIVAIAVGATIQIIASR
jgi:hypothetical protein